MNIHQRHAARRGTAYDPDGYHGPRDVYWQGYGQRSDGPRSETPRTPGYVPRWSSTASTFRKDHK